MSTVPSNSVASRMTDNEEIRIVSHSSLFYWWPVWLVGFIMAGLSYFSHSYMLIVPEGVALQQQVKVVTGSGEPVHGIEGERSVLVLPSEKESRTHSKWETDSNNAPRAPYLHVSRNKNLGVLFFVVLLLVITITNVAMRGLWSVIVIVSVIFLSIIFALLGWWEYIFDYLNFLDVRINAGGYLLVSSVLFVLWLIVFFFFDRQIYMVFTPGQLRVRLEIGDAETAYDTAGMTIQKQRSDLFRHWILGFGSGDLLVRTAGAQAHNFDMPNVLFLGRRVREIEEMLRSKPVVAGMQQHA